MFQILLCSWLRTIELHAVSGSCVRMTSRPRLAAVIQSKGSAALSRDVWRVEGPVLEVRGRWSIDFCWQSHRDFSREQCSVSFRHAAKWFSFILFQTVLHHRLSRDTEYRSLCYTVRLHAHLFYMPVCVSHAQLWPHRLQLTRLLCPWGFSRQEYWSGLPCPPPGDLPNPGIKPRSPALQMDPLPSEPPGKPKNTGVDSLSLLQGIFLTQELNQGLLHCKQCIYQLRYQGRVSHIVGCMC